MASRKIEIDHSEVRDRTLSEWKKIYSITQKAYGIRINDYKGKQSLVYLPDMIEGVKVILFTCFPSGCAVICNKRHWDRLDEETRIDTTIAYIMNPEKFPGEFAKIPHNYIVKNKKEILMAIGETDNAEALRAYMMLMCKNINVEAINDMFTIFEQTIECKAYLMTYKADKYTAAELERAELLQIEKELGFREKTVADWKKDFVIVNEDDGVCLNGYKGDDEIVVIPERIGKKFVRSINIGFFLCDALCGVDMHPPIKKIIVPDGIKVGAFRDEKQTRMIMRKIAFDGISDLSSCGLRKEIHFPEIEIIERANQDGAVEVSSPIIPPKVEIGSVIKLGSYPGASADNGIDWVVTAIENGKALLLTKNLIEGCSYNAFFKEGVANWASMLYCFAFNKKEQEICVREAGSACTFILTTELYEKYNMSQIFATARPSASLLCADMNSDRDGNCCWVIDTTSQDCAYREFIAVCPDGKFGKLYNQNGRIGLRPAMWIALNQ